MSYKCTDCGAEATTANCYRDLSEESNYLRHNHFTGSLFCEECASRCIRSATKLVSINDYLALVAMVKL